MYNVKLNLIEAVKIHSSLFIHLPEVSWYYIRLANFGVCFLLDLKITYLTYTFFPYLVQF
jgi:hypothetical protein